LKFVKNPPRPGWGNSFFGKKKINVFFGETFCFFFKKGESCFFFSPREFTKIELIFWARKKKQESGGVTSYAGTKLSPWF